MVAALDDAVGNVTAALERRGILDNTIIIFSTDNGGPANGFDMNHACNWPLRCELVMNFLYLPDVTLTPCNGIFYYKMLYLLAIMGFEQ